MTKKENSHENVLQESIKKKLEANGELNKIRANLRLHIFNMLRKSSDSPLTDFSNNKWTHYNLINEMILEYFQSMSFNYSTEIFTAEIGYKCTAFNRNELEKKLETMSTSEMHFDDDLPLLLTTLNKILHFEE